MKNKKLKKKSNVTLPHHGAIFTNGGFHFSVWAPQRKNVEVLFHKNQKRIGLQKDANGFFNGWTNEIHPGGLYSYVLDKKEIYPDPSSRFQPKGPHGPSMAINGNHFKWQDEHWPGLTIKGQVIYELHVGTFTTEGTFDAVIPHIDHLLKLGITVLEIMPIAEFPGSRNWGYDGVNLFAPSRAYGDYEAFKRLVNAAHQKGMGVILDVVYNHFGPDGNYLHAYSKNFFTDKYKTDWGAAINFEGDRAIREFFLQNAEYWIREFHLDGLRLDATQSIFDRQRPHILAELEQRTRAAAFPRQIILIAESEPQDVQLVTNKENNGFGLDAIWVDDFHHSAQVALTGKREAYYTDYLGTPQEIISSIKRCLLYQGQYYSWQKEPRGSAVTDHPAWSFVFYLQNHDQVANSLFGYRLDKVTQPSALRAMTTVWLLSPQTPLIFMGQEFGAEQPFKFFIDHNKELAPLVHKGRKVFLSQFPSYQLPMSQKEIPDPNQEESFQECILNHHKRNIFLYRLHQDLLSLRRNDPVICAQDRFHIDGAVLNERAFALRYFGPDGNDRLLVVNLGAAFDFIPTREPLLAPVQNGRWIHLFSSEDIKYGGEGARNPLTNKGWHIPAICANLFQAEQTKHNRGRHDKSSQT